MSILFSNFFSAVPFCSNTETVKVVKAARHEKVELDCSMDPGSIGLDTGPIQGKAKTGLDFRWSLNTSRDQVKLKKAP